MITIQTKDLKEFEAKSEAAFKRSLLEHLKQIAIQSGVHKTDHELTQQIETRVAQTGKFQTARDIARTCELELMRLGGKTGSPSADAVFPDQMVGAATVPCPAPPPVHWLEIELIDEAGEPVPNEEYAVTLPDGVKVSGYLDAKGRARFAPLENGGVAVVSFPGLDSDAWAYLGTQLPGKR